MSRLLHAIAPKAALAAAAALLAVGATAAGATPAAGASTPRATPIPVDHQHCYTAAAKGFRVPAGIRLVNQFSPNGFLPKIGTLALLCNPTIKVLPTGAVVPVTNPRAHLACFRITAPHQPVHVVAVTNQFGQATLATGQPNLLCLPSWKSLTGPPRMKPVQPPGLSHFTCYTVKLAGKAGYHPPSIRLRDEFAPKPVSVRVSPVPAELCLPTEKIVRGKVFPIVNPVTHLLCFPVTKTPIKPRVFVQNQFGSAVVTIGHTSLLCVPSTKRVIR